MCINCIGIVIDKFSLFGVLAKVSMRKNKIIVVQFLVNGVQPQTMSLLSLIKY